MALSLRGSAPRSAPARGRRGRRAPACAAGVVTASAPRVKKRSMRWPPTSVKPGTAGSGDVGVAAQQRGRGAGPARRASRRSAPCRRARAASGWPSRGRWPPTIPASPGARRAAPALGPPAQAQRGVGGDPVAAHEDRVGAAAVGLDEVRAPLGDASAARGSSALRDVSTVRCSAPRGARQRRRPPRRDLLQQRDVPVPSGELVRELVQQRVRRSRGPTRPWKRFQVRTLHRGL